VRYLNLANESSGRDFKALQADIKQWGIGQ
jgi:hypothetical protein